jgi:hypothetical protein
VNSEYVLPAVPEEWSPEEAARGTELDVTEKWVYGLLKPLRITRFKWGGVVDGVKQDAVQIPKEEFERLGGDPKKGGERISFEIDPTTLNPRLEYTVTRSAMRGFPDWKKVVMPSISDCVGLGAGSLQEFVVRARSLKWYVECELVSLTRTDKNGETRTNEVPRFTRMTTDEKEVRSWQVERFHQTPSGPTPEQIAEAKLIFTKMAGRDPEALKNILGNMPTYNGQIEALVGLSNQW